MEACASAHYWAREIGALGHETRLIPPAYVKPFVKRQKNDMADAEAICEAAQRPTMRFVKPKSAEAQGAAVVFRTRDLLVRQRTQLINALRGHLAEFGFVVRQGPGHVSDLMDLVADPTAELPPEARPVLAVIADSLQAIQARTIEMLVIDRVVAKLKPAWRHEETTEARVRAALAKVVLDETSVRLLLRSEACSEDVGTDDRDEPTVEVRVATRLKHRHRATLIGPADGQAPRPTTPDRALVRAICVARWWRQRLESGEVASTLELARLEGLCNRHAGRLLPLAYLAPDLVSDIMEGRQPAAMTLQALTERPLPKAWDAQHQLFASFV